MDRSKFVQYFKSQLLSIGQQKDFMTILAAEVEPTGLRKSASSSILTRSFDN